MKFLVLLLTVFISLFFSDCTNSSSGKNNSSNQSIAQLITEKRQISGFKSVSFNGMGVVTIKKGKSDFITVKADASIINDIETVIQGDTLQIGFKDIINAIGESVEIEITMENIDELRLMGAGKVAMADQFNSEYLRIIMTGTGIMDINAKSKTIDAEIRGAGNIYLKGTTDVLKIMHTGLGQVDAFDLKAQSVFCSLLGAGECKVNAVKTLNIQLTGLGSVLYKGKPDVIQQITGLGSVRNVD
ncbi:MAG: DUF2807 domain-containing protein [Brevinematales bacterium]|nr:DUF2807 domain-containing protein [Brevinematales bacterium]